MLILIDLAEAHNKTINLIDVGDYDKVIGLQHCRLKIEDGNLIYWGREGVFEYKKDNNGNYIRNNNAEIIRIYDESVEPPEIPNFFMDYLFK